MSKMCSGRNLYLICPTFLQLKTVVGLLNGSNTLRKHLLTMRFCEDLTCWSGKECESSFHTLYECGALATLRYFFLSSGKLEAENIRKTHPRTILAFVKVVRLG